MEWNAKGPGSGCLSLVNEKEECSHSAYLSLMSIPSEDP